MAKSSAKHPRTRKRTRFIITIFQSRWPDPKSLDDKFLEDFLGLLDHCVASNPATTEIDLWLVSSGGSAHVAYRLWLALRARCCQLRIVVPDVAKSTATLLALGSDQIVMGAASVLGPLDVQWTHPDNVEATISGLDIAKYPEYLASFAAMHIDCGEAALFFRPLAKKVDGLLTMRVQDELNVASIYAQAMLTGRVHKPSENFCALRRREVCARVSLARLRHMSQPS